MGMLEGQVAIVTGGGRGIGRASCELFSEEGASVVICDMDREPAEETAELVRKNGCRALVCTGDLTDPQLPDQIMAATAKEFGRLDILVNVAGYTASGELHLMPDKQFQDMLDIHLMAPFRLIRASCPLVRDQARKELEEGIVVHRKIVNISSSVAFGAALFVNYAAAKAGVIGLTKAVAKEWAPFNIHCNAVAFGAVDTRLTQARELGVQVKGYTVGIPLERRSRYEYPLGRPATTREAASGIFYLASPLSDYTNGDVIKIDNGSHM